MTEPSLDDAVDIARQIVERCRDAGCNCKPIIRLELDGEHWFADVTHDDTCPHEAADEYVEFQP